MAGVVVGRLRVSDKPDPAARAGTAAAGPLLAARVRGLQRTLLRRHHPLYANFLRRVPTRAELRAHAGTLTYIH